ncbi:MAG TPA: IS481 family transposase [Pseudomonadales bacterium]
MPWSETSAMDHKRLFIMDYLQGTFALTELSARYGISRPTAYKWIERFLEEGYRGLEERSRRPRRCARATPPAQVAAILDLRRRHPFWGAKKLLTILAQRHPGQTWPARSTVCDLLAREGLVTRKRRRRYPGHPGKLEPSMAAPNDTWCIDYKGEFKTGDGRYCYPLTVTDGCSRYLLGCRGLGSTAHEMAKPVLRRLFREYGLPRIIRSDNGIPFATTAIGRLSRLSIWWIRLGIQPELIELGHPEQNGRHERMHRTLKQETTRPAAGTLRAQQRRFDRFRAEFNTVRPHEALGQATPASRYHPSPRPFPTRPPTIEYPAHFETRLMSKNGGFRWASRRVPLSHLLAGQYIGLEEVADGIWDVYYSTVRLGQMDERTFTVEDALGRRQRRPTT